MVTSHMSELRVNAVRRRFWIAWLASCAVLLLFGAAVLAAFFYLHKGPLAASGGWYFFKRTEIPVPQYFQGDPRWANDLLGPTEGTLGAEGCAVASAAMVLKSYGIDAEPGALNQFLTTHGGYTPEGWLYWEKAAEIAPTKARHVYEDAASYYLIDSNLRRGNPVIVRLRYPNGITHFMVICGKDGFDYLVRDPGQGGTKGVYPLKEFGSPIEALRFYEKLP
jgi:hypothetical protein